MIETITESVIAALTASGIKASATELVDWIKNTSQQLPGQHRYDSAKVRELAEKMIQKIRENKTRGII